MPSQSVIGVLHPGEMGAAVGRCLTGVAAEVLWASEGRGPETAARARAAGLTDAGTAAEIAERADVILSICPPHAALDVAWAVQGFGGLFVDANAISPATAREVALMVEEGGATYVDGGIIGQPPPPTHFPVPLHFPPPRRARPACTCLARKPTPCARCSTAPSWTRVVTGGTWSASTVKMAYAAWTKGTAALLLTTLALARSGGVEETLLAEWDLSQPALATWSDRAATSATAKGWRWVAEMEEIAASMAASGLPDGFHQAAAEIFRRSPREDPDTPSGEAVDRVLSAITGEPIRG